MDKWASDGRGFYQIPHKDDQPANTRINSPRARGAASPASPAHSPGKLPSLVTKGSVGASSEAAPASSPRHVRVAGDAAPGEAPPPQNGSGRLKLLSKQDSVSPGKMAALQRGSTKTLQRNGTSVFGLVKGAVGKAEDAKGDSMMEVIADAQRKAYSQVRPTAASSCASSTTLAVLPLPCFPPPFDLPL